MNELKPEDVMRALEKIVSDPNCTNMRYIEGCGHFCKVLREPIDDMASGRSTKCNENCEHYSSPYIEGLIRSALALLREKDAEIERLKLEYAGFEGATKQIIGALKKELTERNMMAEMHRLTVEEIRAEAITEFAELWKKWWYGQIQVAVNAYQESIIYDAIDQIAEEMKGE